MFSKLLNDCFYKSILNIILKGQSSVCKARHNNYYLVSFDGTIYAYVQKIHILQNALENCCSEIRHNINIKKWII